MKARFFEAGWFHALLFGLTAVSMFFASLVFFGGATDGGLEDRLWGSALFTACALLILGAHEMGHFLLARHHRVETSWPWFIPLPLAFGTLGAVIRLRGRIPTRNALVDIGAAGPLAGMAVALPLLVVGLQLAQPVAVSTPAPPLWLGPSSLWSVVHDWLVPAPPGAVAHVATFGDNLLILGLQRLIKGPLPPGTELWVNPPFLAAWFGMLVTMLNLIPVGQLDGGHVTHALFGRHAETLGRVFAGAVLFLAITVAWNWLVWFALVTRVVRFEHPPVVAEEVPLTWGRVVAGGLCLVFLVLLFMPVSLTEF